MSASKAEQLDSEAEEAAPTDLDLQLKLLDAFDIQYTLIRDESGTTIECVGGDRGMKEFSGLAVTYNFGPPMDDPDTSEIFLFIGVVRA